MDVNFWDESCVPIWIYQLPFSNPVILQVTENFEGIGEPWEQEKGMFWW